MIDYLWLKWRIFKTHFWGEENGAVGMVEIVILIAIVVVLAIAFRKKIVEIITNLFDKMNPDEVSKEVDFG